MKQKLIYWLLNTPCPAYDSMKGRMWMKQKVKLWDRVRVRLARWLMGGLSNADRRRNQNKDARL